MACTTTTSCRNPDNGCSVDCLLWQCEPSARELLLAVFLGAEAVNGKEEDEGNVHHYAQRVGQQLALRSFELDVAEGQGCADNAHESTTGNETLAISVPRSLRALLTASSLLREPTNQLTMAPISNGALSWKGMNIPSEKGRAGTLSQLSRHARIAPQM